MDFSTDGDVIAKMFQILFTINRSALFNDMELN